MGQQTTIVVLSKLLLTHPGPTASYWQSRMKEPLFAASISIHSSAVLVTFLQGPCWQRPSTPRLEDTQLLCQPTGPKGHLGTATYRLTGRAHPSCESALSSSFFSLFQACFCLKSVNRTNLCFPSQIWSPPSYATAQILHGLPPVTTGTRHLSARTKLKCNSHFTIIIVIMRHSLMFFFLFCFQKLLLFFHFIFFLFLFICQPVITLFCMVTNSFFFSFAVSVIGTPEGLLTNHGCQSLLFLCRAGACGPSCCCSVGWKNIGHLFLIIASTGHYKDLLTYAAKFF